MLSAHSRVVLLGLYGPDRGQWRLTRYDLSVPGEENVGTAGAEGSTAGETADSVETAGGEGRTAGEESVKTAGDEGRTAGLQAKGAAGKATIETKGRTGQNEEMTIGNEAEKNAEKRRSRSVTETEGTGGEAIGTVGETMGSRAESSATTAGEMDGVVGEDKQTSEVRAERAGTGVGDDIRGVTGEEAAGPGGEGGGAAGTGNPGPETCEDGPWFDGEVNRVALVEQGRPSGMTEVVLNGRTCIALSYWWVPSLRVCSHKAKAKKIKEPAKEIKEKNSKTEMFAFVFFFARCEWALTRSYKYETEVSVTLQIGLITWLFEQFGFPINILILELSSLNLNFNVLILNADRFS